MLIAHSSYQYTTGNMPWPTRGVPIAHLVPYQGSDGKVSDPCAISNSKWCDRIGRSCGDGAFFVADEPLTYDVSLPCEGEGTIRLLGPHSWTENYGTWYGEYQACVHRDDGAVITCTIQGVDRNLDICVFTLPPEGYHAERDTVFATEGRAAKFAKPDAHHLQLAIEYAAKLVPVGSTGQARTHMPTLRWDPTLKSYFGCFMRYDHIAFTPVYSSLSRGEYSYWVARANDMPTTMSTNGIVNVGFTRAYYDAQAQLPKASNNTIANIGDCIKAIKDLRDRKPLATNASDAWLAYRYQYTTTKSDVAEYAALFQRLRQLSQGTIRSYGKCTIGNINYYACIDVNIADLCPPGISGLLDRWGVKLDFVNIWDMIPYSFIVDWLLPISDALDALDSWLQQPKAAINAVWYSFVSVYDTGAWSYGRWSGNIPSLPAMAVHDTSTKTWQYRCIDALALFL